MSEPINVSVTAHVVATCSAHARIRESFVLTHLRGAACFARHAYQIEKNHSAEAPGPTIEELISHVAASVFLSVAALDAFVNELLADDNQGSLSKKEEHGDWRTKCNLASKRRGLPELNWNDPVNKNALTLRKLRNALVHFTPEWSDEKDKHAEVSREIANLFEPSLLFPKNGVLFPVRCMGHGCAEWAAKTVITFLTEAQKRYCRERTDFVGPAFETRDPIVDSCEED